MLGGHVRDVVADSPDTGKRYVSSRDNTRLTSSKVSPRAGEMRIFRTGLAGGVGSGIVATVRPSGISAVGGCATRLTRPRGVDDQGLESGRPT